MAEKVNKADKADQPGQSDGQLPSSRRLARILADTEVLENDELLAVQQRAPDGFLGDTLVKEGILLESYLQSLLIRTLCVPWIAIECLTVPDEVRKLLPEDFCRKSHLLAVSRVRDFLTIAAANPLDEESIEKVREITGLKVRTVLCSGKRLDEILESLAESEEADPDSAEPAPEPPAAASPAKPAAAKEGA